MVEQKPQAKTPGRVKYVQSLNQLYANILTETKKSFESVEVVGKA
jgi:hypothetical protein